MKKDYLKPEAEVLDIVTSTLIATSPGDINESDTTDGKLDAGNNRGEWGNIWGK